MRTERFRAVVPVVTAVALAALAGVPAQGQGPPPPAPAAPGAQSRDGTVVTGDHVVRAGEVVDHVVVVGGDLRVLGEVTGDAVVVGGDLVLAESGLVRGDALVTGGSLLEEGGRVLGEMRVMEGAAAEMEREARNLRLEAEMERHGADDDDHRDAAGVGRAVEREIRRNMHSRGGWFDSIGRGFAGLIQTLALGLVLGGLGALLIFYGHRNLDTVSDTLRSAALRSAGVGLAASFLIVPAFVVLVVALAVTIVGIPLLLLAVPLYPLAVAAAITFGLLATAHAIGEHTAEKRREAYDLRYRNSYAYLFTGLGMLLTPLLAADLIAMTGFLGIIGTLLKVVTWMVIWAAATAGFGAVILSRGGTKRTFVHHSRPEAPFESDPLFEQDTPAGGSNV